MRATFAATWLLLFCSAAAGAAPALVAGFNGGAAGWDVPELAGVTDRGRRRRVVERLGYTEAELAARYGATMLRINYSAPGVPCPAA